MGELQKTIVEFIGAAEREGILSEMDGDILRGFVPKWWRRTLELMLKRERVEADAEYHNLKAGILGSWKEPKQLELFDAREPTSENGLSKEGGHQSNSPSPAASDKHSDPGDVPG